MPDRIAANEPSKHRKPASSRTLDHSYRLVIGPGLTRLLALGLLLLGGFGSPVNAATVVTEPGCEAFGFRCFIGFGNLQIVGQQYDLRVVQGPLAEVIDAYEPDLSSWGDPAFAAAAAVEIEVAINAFVDLVTDPFLTVFIEGLPNTLGVYPVRLLLPVSIGESVVLGNLGPAVFGQCVESPGFGAAQNVFAYPCELSGAGGTVNDVIFSVATFTPTSPVPLPPALWLFACAMLGLAGTARRV